MLCEAACGERSNSQFEGRNGSWEVCRISEIVAGMSNSLRLPSSVSTCSGRQCFDTM